MKKIFTSLEQLWEFQFNFQEKCIMIISNGTKKVSFTLSRENTVLEKALGGQIKPFKC